MLKDSEIWEYAELSKTAKEHGGPDGLVDDIRQGAYADGESAGLAEGVIIAAISYALFRGGKWVYGKAKGWYAAHRKGEQSADELIADLREYEAEQKADDSIAAASSDVDATSGEEE